MKGLLTKDFALLKQRKKIIIILALWSVVMCFAMDDGSFVMGWMTIICAFFTGSSIAYDEYDNCLPSLMCLPITGKTYAIEKYLFGFLCGIVAWLYSAAVYLLITFFALKGDATDIIQNAVFIPIFMLIIDISLPLNLKFGSERGRMIGFIFGGVAFVALFLVAKLLDGSFSPELPSVSLWALIAASFAAAAVVTLISMVISISIVKKKAY